MNENENCITQYISEQPERVQLRLNQVRESICEVLPEAEERITWRMPTYWKGHNIIHFAAFKKHIGLYPGPEAVIHFEEALREYKTSKGAIQLPFDKPLPISLVKEIAKWCYQSCNHH